MTVIGIALAFAGVVLWATSDSEDVVVVEGGGLASGVEASRDAASRSDRSDAASDELGERAAITGQGEEGPERARSIQVVDGTFGFGLLAWLVPDGGAWLRTSRDGEFDMHRALEQSTFEVSASGYHPKRVLIESESGDRIELEPRGTCGVRVLSSEDGPVDSASVTWSPAERRGEPLTPDVSVTTVTGGDGVTSIAAASACQATVEADGRPPRTVHVPVGETIDVRLSDGTTVLTVVCGDTEQPVEGVRLRLSRPWDRNGVTRTAISDESGRVVLARGDGPLEIELVERTYWLYASLPQGWIARNKVEATYVGDIEAAETGRRELRLPIECETLDVKLVDGATGSLIRGPVRYGYTTPKIERHGSSYDLVETQDCCDGVLRVRAVDYEVERINEPRIGGYELVVWPEGYQLENLGLLTLLEQGDATVNEARFTPAKQRTLRIHDAAGRPVTSEFTVRSEDGHIRYHDGVGTAEGLYGPFDWNGGGLTVTRRLPNPGGGGLGGAAGSEEVARVSSEQLTDSEQVSVEVNLPVAEVKVVRVDGRDGGVIVVDHAGLEHAPVNRSEDEVVFRGVPAGPVFVGPPAWARQLYSRRFYGVGRVSMKAIEDETLVVPFDAEWEAGKNVRGRIRVVGEETSGLFLIPAYCTTSVPVPKGLRTPWLPVREDGTYSIARGEPLPRALIVCSIVSGRGHIASSGRTGSFVVLDVIEPGADAELHANPVELVWGGPDRAEPTTVRWSFTGGSYTHPDGAVLARYAPARGELLWSDTEPRRFGPFPEGQLELGCDTGAGWWTRTVTSTGKELRVVPVGP